MIYLDIARDDNGQAIQMIAKMANRHGLIAGATGTGKSITLRKMAESFSNQGVPVFLVDVKGDFSGLANRGAATGKIAQRVEQYHLGNDYYQKFPVRFWDIYGELGIPVRVKVSDMGAMLLSRLLGLNANQEGLLNLVFKVADDKGWLLVDLKDLRALLKHVADHAKEYKTIYGNVSAASIGAIQRQLLVLEKEGANLLFGEPALKLTDLIQLAGDTGVINILAAEKLMRTPKTFSAFLLWLMAEMFVELPEVGDLEKPKLVMFFDEAHLLFDNAPSALLEQIQQVVRLIRSKGVGIYFCTQNPLDLPETILGQLGNRVQHALRAFTPKDKKSVKAAAETFRENPNLDTVTTISILGVGEALISFLDAKGMPQPVEKGYVLPPASQIPPISEQERKQIIDSDPKYPYYKNLVDNYTAFEALLAEEKNQQQQEATTLTQENPVENKAEPNFFIGFIRGLLGIRKHTNAGIGYDVSNEIGKSVSKEAKRNISKVVNRTIMGVINKK